MNLSYYTVDDLRLGHDPKGVVGWRMSQFLSLDDALTHYVSLPATGVWRAKKLYIKPCEVIKLFWSKSRCSPLFNASLFQERGVAKISISA